MAPVKRRHKTITLKEKLEIIEKLEKGQSGRILAQEYGIGRATVSDFKRQKEKIREYAKKHLPVDIKHKARSEIARTM